MCYLDPDSHSFSKLEPDPHLLKKLDPDPHKSMRIRNNATDFASTVCFRSGFNNLNLLLDYGFCVKASAKKTDFFIAKIKKKIK
jgi:hypothetical protein